jgi:copper chaperone CopZ
MKKVYNLKDLDCANCASKMEEAIKRAVPSIMKRLRLSWCLRPKEYTNVSAAASPALP